METETDINIEKDILIPLDKPIEATTTKDKYEMRSVAIPPNRMTATKNNWEKIC